MPEAAGPITAREYVRDCVCRTTRTQSESVGLQRDQRDQRDQRARTALSDCSAWADNLLCGELFLVAAS